MSQLLVAAVDQPGALRYKQGDVIAVYPDGYVFQRSEGLPWCWQFTVLNILGADRTTFLEELRDDPFFPQLMTRRRKRFIDVTQLSNQAQNSLANTGKATVLRAAVIAALTLHT